mmetsp:Transcript_24045/g.31401  ORF Transcript_24045/g.31401 Transcript_24045/m.31401 type:complete len:98 (-) Transcript_24045:322-615(-)
MLRTSAEAEFGVDLMLDAGGAACIIVNYIACLGTDCVVLYDFCCVFIVDLSCHSMVICLNVREMRYEKKLQRIILILMMRKGERQRYTCPCTVSLEV